LLAPTAALAARLHASDAFHRDLYLCHFFAKLKDDGGVEDLRLIDCARVLIKPFWRRRWQVKDLSAFAYSTRGHAVRRETLDRWFAEYASAMPRPLTAYARRLIDLKADRIARHDAALRRRQPTRNISIPQ
jgi:heptose I phosphotransferase